MTFRFIIVLIFICFLSGCSDPRGNKLDTKSIKEQMEDRKIHQVKPADIINQSKKNGERIVGLVEKQFLTRIKSQVAKNPLSESLKRCNINFPLRDSLEKFEKVAINRYALHLPLPEKANKIENEMWDAYRYNVEKRLKLTENVQAIKKNQMLYTKGIIINDASCLRCHGVVGKDLKEDDYKTLKKNNPTFDSLVNYKMNNAIGIWSVLMDKKNIIKKIK